MNFSDIDGTQGTVKKVVKDLVTDRKFLFVLISLLLSLKFTYSFFYIIKYYIILRGYSLFNKISITNQKFFSWKLGLLLSFLPSYELFFEAFN